MASPRSAALPPASASALPSTRGTPPSCSARSSSTMQLDAAIWTQNFAQRSRRFVYIWVSRHQHNTRRSAVHLRYGLPPLLPWCSAGPLFRPAPELGSRARSSLPTARSGGGAKPSRSSRIDDPVVHMAIFVAVALDRRAQTERVQHSARPRVHRAGGVKPGRQARWGSSTGLDYCTAHMRHATAAPQPLHVALVPSRPTRKR